MNYLLPEETKIIIQNMKPEVRKLLEDLDEESYKQIAAEIISIARPMIEAKVLCKLAEQKAVGELKEQAEALNKELDDREADLINAKKEEREAICQFLISQRANLIDIKQVADGSYRQALKEEK